MPTIGKNFFVEFLELFNMLEIVSSKIKNLNSKQA
jgi:hypothetical protein